MLAQQPLVAANAAVETTARPATAAILTRFFFTLRSFVQVQPKLDEPPKSMAPLFAFQFYPDPAFSLRLTAGLWTAQAGLK